MQTISPRSVYEIASIQHISLFLHAVTQAHGFTSGEIKKLQDAGYFSIQSIAFATKKDLCTVKGISENKADKLLEVGSLCSALANRPCSF